MIRSTRLRFTLRALLVFVAFTAVATWYFKTPVAVAKTDAVCKWLASQDEDMMQLVWSHEAITPSAGEGVSPHRWPDFERQLFGTGDYDDEGYLFNHLAYQGDGSNYFIWMNPRHNGPPAVVHINIYGKYRVVGKSIYLWPALLANGYDVKMYSNTDAKHFRQQQAALARLTKLVTDKFGVIPDENTLNEGLQDLQDEFEGWVNRNRH